MKRDQRGDPPDRLGIHAPGDLRPPVMQAAHEGHHHAADHDVMEMRDDEISVVQMDIHRHGGEEKPGQVRQW